MDKRTKNILDNFEKIKITRRCFLKTSALFGGSALLASKLEWLAEAHTEQSAKLGLDEYSYQLQKASNIIRSTCLQCHTDCPLQAKLFNGILAKIDGNPYSPQNRLVNIPYDTSIYKSAKFDG